MKFAKLAWRLIFVVVLLLSITLNVAMFLGGSMYMMASSAFESATGIRTVAAQHADEVADLGSNLAYERRLNRELRGEVAEVSDNLIFERKISRKLKREVTDLTGHLAAEKAAQRKLKNEVADLSGNLAAERLASNKARSQLADAGADVVTYRGKKMARSQAVKLTADSISKRAVKTSSRSISSMAGKAIPSLGTAVIVGVTTLELKDLCDTLRDMSELRRSFAPDATVNEDETTVCAMKVPSAQELWEVAKSSPETAWNAAKASTPSLKEIQQLEFPDVDWTAAWVSTMEGTESAWSATKNGAGTAIDVTLEATSGIWDGAKKYWADEPSDTQYDE